MDMRTFRRTYPYLSTALGGDFHDSDHGDDVVLARGVRSDLKGDDRVRFFTDLVEQTHKAISNIEAVWENIPKEAGRMLSDMDSTKIWLENMQREWKAELKRISEK